MDDKVTLEKLSHLLVVESDYLDEAVSFYKSLFKAEEIESFYCCERKIKLWVELKISNARIIVCTDVTGDFVHVASIGGAIVELETVDVNASLAAAKNAGVVEMECITEVEAHRGVKAKVVDPFGFIWSFAEKIEVPVPVPVLQCSSTRPFLFPALQSEVVWWVLSRKFVGRAWRNTLDDVLKRRLQVFEAGMDIFEKSLLQLKMLKFFYKKNNLIAFDRHPSLKDVLSELERINGILQGIQLIFFINPMVKSSSDINSYNRRLNRKYNILSNKLPSIACNPMNWPNLIRERKDAACDVRQLLKSLLKVRANIHQKLNIYETSVLYEEFVMDEMISHEVKTWRIQDKKE